MLSRSSPQNQQFGPICRAIKICAPFVGGAILSLLLMYTFVGFFEHIYTVKSPFFWGKCRINVYIYKDVAVSG